MQALFMTGKGELPPVPDSLSRDAHNFILKCIQLNPNDRPTAAQLLDHPFVRRPLQNSFDLVVGVCESNTAIVAKKFGGSSLALVFSKTQNIMLENKA